MLLGRPSTTGISLRPRRSCTKTEGGAKEGTEEGGPKDWTEGGDRRRGSKRGVRRTWKPRFDPTGLEASPKESLHGRGAGGRLSYSGRS